MCCCRSNDCNVLLKKLTKRGFTWYYCKRSLVIQIVSYLPAKSSWFSCCCLPQAEVLIISPWLLWMTLHAHRLGACFGEHFDIVCVKRQGTNCAAVTHAVVRSQPRFKSHFKLRTALLATYHLLLAPEYPKSDRCPRVNKIRRV